MFMSKVIYINDEHTSHVNGYLHVLPLNLFNNSDKKLKKVHLLS